MKGVEMFGYVITVGRVVVALASVATAIGAYGCYELYRRSNPRKKKVDVSEVLDRHFGSGQEHLCGGRGMDANMSESFTSAPLKPDRPVKEQQYAQGYNDEPIKRGPVGDSMASDTETSTAEVRSGLLDGIDLDCLSDGFRELVENRVAALHSIENDEDGWGLKAVDLYDELQRLVDSSFEGERHVLNAILSRIASELDTKGFAQIKLSEWNPEFQNAVVVTQGECSEGIKVIDTISSGVKRNGQVLRKQEVSILTSKKEM